MPKNELQDVLDKAVEAYRICKTRNRPRTRPRGDLDKIYPNHFRKLDNGSLIWVGKSADDVIEDYLSQFGYSMGSHLWHQLTCIVIMRAKRVLAKELSQLYPNPMRAASER